MYSWNQPQRRPWFAALQPNVRSSEAKMRKFQPTCCSVEPVMVRPSPCTNSGELKIPWNDEQYVMQLWNRRSSMWLSR